MIPISETRKLSTKSAEIPIKFNEHKVKYLDLTLFCGITPHKR